MNLTWFPWQKRFSCGREGFCDRVGQCLTTPPQRCWSAGLGARTWRCTSVRQRNPLWLESTKRRNEPVQMTIKRLLVVQVNCTYISSGWLCSLFRLRPAWLRVLCWSPCVEWTLPQRLPPLLSPRRWDVEVAVSALFWSAWVELLISSERGRQSVSTGGTVASSVCGGRPNLDAVLWSGGEDRLQEGQVVLWSMSIEWGGEGPELVRLHLVMIPAIENILSIISNSRTWSIQLLINEHIVFSSFFIHSWRFFWVSNVLWI